MIETEYFYAFAFPWALFSEDGSLIGTAEGALFNASPKSFGQDCLEHYKNSPEGWSCDPIGYACYTTTTLSQNMKFVVFGLKVAGVSKIKGKSEVLSIKSNTKDIEIYVTNYLNTGEKIELLFNRATRANIHEVRDINSDIYNIAYALNTANDGNSNIQNDILRIVALSETLKIRIDFLDALTNPVIASARGGQIPIYRNFDRMRRSLKVSADSKNLTIIMKGQSQGRIHAIKLFDVIPYLVIQNSIKYSPENETIIIDIQENASEITVIVTSLGPKIDSDETSRIFTGGFRGRNAKKHSTEGSGLGLFVLKELVEKHQNGIVVFYQEDDNLSINDIPYARTFVTIRLPKAEY